MQFSATAINVLILFLYFIPGYILIKAKAVKEDQIKAFAKVLLYVCQPCLSIYSFQKASYSLELVKNMGIFVGLNIGLMLIILLGCYVVLRKRYDDCRNRILTLAAAFGNVGFIGIPLLEALLPDNPEVIAYNAVFIVAMNVMSWTLGFFILTGDKKYFHPKKIFLNPPVLSLLVSLPLFFTGTTLPTVLGNGIGLLGKMTTPLCMMIAGMRFATSDIKALFTEPRVYIAAALKLIAMPLLAFLTVNWLPVDYPIKATMVILCSCPTASLVLNFAEVYGDGQKTASYTVLASTIFSMLTIPLVLLIL